MVPIDQTLDCRDRLCPGPVIEVSKAIKGLPLNGVLEVLATDPGFRLDMEAFSRRTGHALLASEQGVLGVRVLIRRSR